MEMEGEVIRCSRGSYEAAGRVLVGQCTLQSGWRALVFGIGRRARARGNTEVQALMGAMTLVHCAQV